jgi:transposase
VDRRTGALNLAEGIMVFLGIDVSKDRLDCALLAAQGVKVLGGRSFPNDTAGIDRAKAWVERISGLAAAEVHVVLEATAAYHEAAAHRLAAAGMRVSIANSARVRSFGKGLGILGKTDPIDARLLARYGQLVHPRAWRPPARALLDLEALLARLDDIEGDLRREESRLEQARTRGCPALVESSLLESIEVAKGRRSELRRAIAAQVAACPELRADLDRLLTIPAVGPRTAMRMLVLLRARAFESARQVAACLGFVPVERTSGKSVRARPALSKTGNPRLRAALYMAAIVGVRCNPDLHAQYERLLGRGKCKMSALIAAMRKLVHLCFGVLKSATDYRPSATNSR